MPLDDSLNSAKRAIISEVLGNVEDVIIILFKSLTPWLTMTLTCVSCLVLTFPVPFFVDTYVDTPETK